MKKSIPTFKTDEEAEAFLEQDLSDYIHAENFHPVSFEFMPKDEKVNLRISGLLLNKIRLRAKRQGLPFQKYMRLVLERDVLSSGPH